MQQGKRFAKAVARSNMDIESRAVVRQKEAELAITRKAAWIAKEVRTPFQLVLHASKARWLATTSQQSLQRCMFVPSKQKGAGVCR